MGLDNNVLNLEGAAFNVNEEDLGLEHKGHSQNKKKGSSKKSDKGSGKHDVENGGPAQETVSTKLFKNAVNNLELEKFD